MVAIGVACQVSSRPAPTPFPSPTPHRPVTLAVLQSADVPASLKPCSASGDIDAYLTELLSADSALAGRVRQQWQSLKQGGAHAGAISLFASDASACSKELGAG